MSHLFASSVGMSLDDVVSRIGDAVCVTDRHMVFLAANKAFANFYGLATPDLVLGKSAFEVYPGFKGSIFYEACQATIESGQETSRIGYSNNLRTWLVSRCYPIGEDRFAMIVHRATDDTTKMGYVNHTDPLTSLPNRWSLEADLKVLSDMGQNLTLAMVDIDHFKKFNENMGFEAGNRALMEIAARLKSGLLPSERAYRIGNDQFVLMGTAGEEDLFQRLHELLPLLSEPLTFSSKEYVLRFNVGLAHVDRSEPTEEAMKRTEIALYNAKASRSGFARYVPEMETSAYDPSLIKQIRDAIKLDQLVLFYQPQVDLIDGKVAGAEVLVRWKHPERGLVPPVEFLPFAEETGLIQEIDHAVIRKTFERVKSLSDQGLAIPLSLNLSAQSICDLRTVDLFRNMLEEWKLDPSMIGIEITETSLMRDVGISQKVSEALKELGFKISIDDFGSGYSSMAYLLRYPSQFLKIDRAFVSSLSTSPPHQVMVRNIINLAHGLGIAVVAEGVEQKEECELLEEFGCDLVQGYYFTPPLEEEAFCTWVRARGVAVFHSSIH